MTVTLQVGEFTFDVVRSSRRKTIEIGVERDGGLVLRAPEGMDDARLVTFANRKRAWVYEKLALKQALAPAPTRKEFVSGEGFRYLGRSYKLHLVAQQSAALKLIEGRFRLLRSEVPRARELFVAWYIEHGCPWLKRRVQDWTTRIGVDEVHIDVRDLGYRWGSCGPGGRVYFNWATVTLPPSIVDYVVVHELVHVKHAHHGPEFWAAMARAMPDFAARKLWLAERGSEHGL